MHCLCSGHQDLCAQLVSCPAGAGWSRRLGTDTIFRPHHRGTATAFPLAAFGLSAFFFSLVGGFLFPGDTSDFLLLLSCGTTGLTFAGFWGLKVIEHGPGKEYQSIATDEDSPARLSKEQARRPGLFVEPGRFSHNSNPTKTNTLHRLQAGPDSDLEAAEAGSQPHDSTSGRSGESSNLTTAASSTMIAETDDGADETSSLLSSRVSSVAGEVYVQNVDMDRSHRADIRGWNLIKNIEFWQLFAVMGILAGVGLMTIK